MTRIEEMVLASATRGPDGYWRFEEHTAEEWRAIGERCQQKTQFHPQDEAEADEAFRITGRLQSLDRASARQEIGLPSGGDIPLPPGAARLAPHEELGVLAENVSAGQILSQDPDDLTWSRYNTSLHPSNHLLCIAVQNGRAGDTIILTTSMQIHVGIPSYPSLLSGEGTS